MFNQFDAYINDLISDFAGITQQNKTYFSENVLPLINKGWKLVCWEEEGKPCLNCYAYNNPCLNCIQDNKKTEFYMSFDDYQYICSKDKYKTYNQFKKECEFEYYTYFMEKLNNEINKHPIIKYQNLIEIV